MSQVRVIGLDGGTFTVIDYLTGQGRLPNFARLMKGGSRATLLSTAPPVTWPAWASFYTGTNPGKTGAADLFKFIPGTYKLEPMNAGNLKGTPIWSLASSRDKQVCVYNVPVTYPAVPVNGIMISGLDAPSFNDQAIYPLEFKDQLLAAIPDFKINFENDAKYLVNHHKNPVQEWIRQAKGYLEMEIRVINYLMGLKDWDLFVAVIRSTDIFQHTLWRDAEKVINGEPVSAEEQEKADAVFACYESIDEQFGEMISGWNTDHNLVIMSDHGFGQLYGHVSLNRVFADSGLLKFHPVAKPNHLRAFLGRQLRDHLPVKARDRIKRLLGKEKAGGRWLSYVDVLIADIDWNHTRICSIGGFGCLFVNMKDRFPLGTVADEQERQAVLAEAEAALLKLKDPRDGQPLVTRFYRKEELYNGPLMPEIPDMMVDFRDWSYCPVIGTANELSREEIIRPPVQEWKQLAHSGTHRREGILVLHGPDIGQADLGTAAMVDVAPTIMALLGLPSLEDWDGRVLAEALPDAVGQEVAAAGVYDLSESEDSGQTYSDEEQEKIRKQLEDLGYL